jgi:iron(III) transport system permease protein
VFGVEYGIYGLDGLVFVLPLSLFPVAYLGLLGIWRGLDPALEEAAISSPGSARPAAARPPP